MSTRTPSKGSSGTSRPASAATTRRSRASGYRATSTSSPGATTIATRAARCSRPCCCARLEAPSSRRLANKDETPPLFAGSSDRPVSAPVEGESATGGVQPAQHVHCNAMQAHGGPFDLTLDFGYRVRPDDDPTVVARVSMSWEHVVSMLKVLQGVVDGYQRQVGPIPDLLALGSATGENEEADTDDDRDNRIEHSRRP